MKKNTLCLVLCFIASAWQPLFAAKDQNYVAIDLVNQKAILYSVNAYRQKHHLAPLQFNSLMSEEAARHSRDMASHRVPFGHTHFDKRIHRLFGKIKDSRGGAENVAYNYKNGEEVVRNWLTSPGHRRNIEGHYNLTGIGLARDNKGKLYFTQLFIRTH
ncbi:MAG: CAP domain-containing protein [Tatlockia sp.]|jgi:uncharacterized protein YkwD